MAPPKKKVTIKFEIRQAALGGIGLVMCCLFLWTFIMGVWLGQSMLAPEVKREKGVSNSAKTTVAQPKKPKDTKEEQTTTPQISSKNKEQDKNNSNPIHIRARRKVVKKIQ